MVTLVEDLGGAGRVRSGMSPPVSSDSPWNLLKMVDASGEESTPSNVFESIHLM